MTGVYAYTQTLSALSMAGRVTTPGPLKYFFVHEILNPTFKKNHFFKGHAFSHVNFIKMSCSIVKILFQTIFLGMQRCWEAWSILFQTFPTTIHRVSLKNGIL